MSEHCWGLRTPKLFEALRSHSVSQLVRFVRSWVPEEGRDSGKTFIGRVEARLWWGWWAWLFALHYVDRDMPGNILYVMLYVDTVQEWQKTCLEHVCMVITYFCLHWLHKTTLCHWLLREEDTRMGHFKTNADWSMIADDEGCLTCWCRMMPLPFLVQWMCLRKSEALISGHLSTSCAELGLGWGVPSPPLLSHVVPNQSWCCQPISSARCLILYIVHAHCAVAFFKFCMVGWILAQ